MTERETIVAVRKAIRLRHMALSTERTYIHWVRRYCRAILKHADGLSSRSHIERFLSDLARADCSASTQNQAFNAIMFLYREVLHLDVGDVQALRAKKPKRARTAPAQQELAALLLAVEDIHNYPTRLIVHLQYGCGLRVSEPLNLRLKDLDFERMRIQIRDGKGKTDRIVAMPGSLSDQLGEQARFAQCMWERDNRNRLPVPLPHALGRKYRNAGFAMGWYWLFPAHKPCKHPRTGETVRYRCHDSNVQRAVRAAAKSIGADAVITPHVLRHAYATHAIERGASVTDVQAAMGHKHLDTTMGYVTPDAIRVASPLEACLTC